LNINQVTNLVKTYSNSLGFEYCGIARAEALPDEARKLENWLSKGFHASMNYMEKHFEMRVDPTRLVPGAKSVITMLLNYYPVNDPPSGIPKISKYAYGKDYHDIIKGKLKEFLTRIQSNIGQIHGRGFVDSAPVLERAWAQRSGLGWIGKNGNLINRKSGSFLFIATLITDLELEYDDPYAADYCGTCTRCVDACPTEAIMDGKVIDGGRCISYLTIELKDQIIPQAMKGKFDGWIFGCDICQDVCPWNRFSKASGEAGLNPLPGLFELTATDWAEMTEDSFRKNFGKSALARAKLSGIKRNVRFAINAESHDPDSIITNPENKNDLKLGSSHNDQHI